MIHKILALTAALAPVVFAQDFSVTAGENCTFIAAPDEILSKEGRLRKESYERTLMFARATKGLAAARPVAASDLPVRSFIDEEIFRRLDAEGVPAAALSTDAEFCRRIYLDLTGRLPSADEIRAFAADAEPSKRDLLIDKLLYSPQFIDKWTVWLGDILQNSQTAQNRNQNQEGRNRMHEWMRNAIDTGKSWRDIATEVVIAVGNNYDRDTPGTNFVIRGFAPMGPAQDTYDMLLVRSASMFLGLSNYDCLLCHDGRFHLDSVNAWASKVTRLEAQRMAAHFTRVQMNAYPGNDATNYYNGSFTVVDRTTGTYDLNTTYGNRPNRVAPMVNGKAQTNQTPVYRNGTAAGSNWRQSFAQSLVADPMFARNYANRVWKAMFNMALAEPVDALDPVRLDPSVPPPAGWSYQASHPELLEKLAQATRDSDFNLRDTLRLIARSSAYQLSSRYDAAWDLTKSSLFARHLPRRLEAEEVHDAITRATGLMPAYTVGGWTEKVGYAMQLPEPVEPRSDGTANAFMNSFSRGNRDTLQRSQSGSILMMLNLMNNAFVMNRLNTTGATASPYLTALAKNTSNDAVIEDIFLTFLGRRASDYEKSVALKTLQKATTTQYTRAMAVSDLAWALINKTDFLFSY